MPQSGAGNETSGEWKQGWGIVLAACLGFSFTGMASGSISIFMGPLSEEFGWSRTLISSGFTISALITGLLSAPMGAVIDRFGSRRIAIPGVIGTTLCFAAFSLANGSLGQWLALWVIFALVALLVKPAVWMVAVVGAFTTGRGLALGIAIAGTAAAQIIMPPLATWLIGAFDWRMAYPLLGFGWGGATLVICWLFFFDPRHRRDEASGDGQTTSGSAAAVPGLTIPEAWRSPTLWWIALSTLITMGLTSGLGVHQFEILHEAGVTRTYAAWLTSLAGIAALLGKLVTGLLLDRFRPNVVGGLSLAASALAFGLLFAESKSPGLIVVAMFINGYTQGAKLQIIGYLTSAYAGLRNFGAIYGAMGTAVAIGSGIGPLIAGVAYDHAGNYGAFLILGTAGSIISGLVVLSLPAYPKWSGDHRDDRSSASNSPT